MGKAINRFVCSECGYETVKWMGKCPGCAAWNTLIEELVSPKAAKKSRNRYVEAIPLGAISDQEIYRFSSGIGELNRVLGGGIVPGSLVLIGGDPGIGKSTLLLQVADRVARTGSKVLYLSGEESLKQIRLRSMRLDVNSNNIYLVNEQDIDQLENYIKDIDPVLVIIDSIQTVYSQDISSIPGSVSQLRECTARISDIAKRTEKTFFLVGHVTKDGALAGPKVLEHMVDVVVYFEGEKNFSFRLLRGIKNRFGATDEIGLLEMSSQGLVEVKDPSYIFLSSSSAEVSGTAIAASFEGSRPLLIEIQALVSPTGPGYPRRMASGIDQNRLALIIAVLEKRLGYNLSAYDVYLKVTGGVFLKDPSVDLGIAAAIISSYCEYPLANNTVFSGELSLSGQIRPVPFLDMRLKEIAKMGYKRAVIPGGATRVGFQSSSLELLEVSRIDEFIDIVMEG
ncbi:MAG: DNA repair protein RadA [Syntrophomonadaceae bacterium]|nr:DNA repair protein RadA [Syntrophomonadaceae bacterium]MDD3889228.1 DNA repair protein RadA [Syntrophomonadaceae bacterium]MDD4550475.1 DNA repair protein RadA [Syntrophomonadaceae bacterium]